MQYADRKLLIPTLRDKQKCYTGSIGKSAIHVRRGKKALQSLRWLVERKNRLTRRIGISRRWVKDVTSATSGGRDGERVGHRKFSN